MSQSIFSDDPLDEHSADRLDRTRYAQHVANVVQTVREHGSSSSVLAVVGPWGGGKSTILNMVRQCLNTAGENWRVAEFTPWIYPDIESMQAGFFRELRAVLPKDDQWKKTGETIENLGTAISPLGKFTALLGVDSSEPLKALAKVLAGDTSINKTKELAQEALRKLAEPILLVLDDLDRLSPDELLMVFKLVRFVGRLPNVYYLLSYDEITLTDVLMRTDLAANDRQRARDYLEKMVQVRLDLPALRPQQATALVNDSIDSILNRNTISLGDEDFRRLSSAYYEAMYSRLQTPRAIRRFFAQLDAFYPSVGTEVDFVDFTCLTWIRTFEPDAYQFIHANRNAFTGALKHDRESDSGREYWTDLLKSVGISERRSGPILTLLAAMFLQVRKPFGSSIDAGSYEDLRERRGIGHPDYFDRYFAFGVPSDDIPDSTVRHAFDSSSENFIEAYEVLAQQFMSDTARVTRKMRSLVRRREVDPFDALNFSFTFLQHVPAGGDIFDNPRRSIEYLTRDALMMLSPGEGPSVLSILATSPEVTLHLAWEVARLTRPESTTETPAFQWPGPALSTMSSIVRSSLEGGDWQTIDEVPPDTFRLIWPWNLMSPDDCRAFIQSMLPKWGLLPILERLVPESTLYGSETIVHQLGKLTPQEIARFVDLDDALAELGTELETLPLDSAVGDAWTIEPSPENRRTLVLEALREEQKRRSPPGPTPS